MTALREYAETQIKGRVASPQMERTPGRNDEVVNNAGGYVFSVSDRQRLERFLILGVDGGTYYVKESDLLQQNIDFLRDMIVRDERAVVDTLVDVADNNRAPKNSPSLFVLALVMQVGKDKEYVRASRVVSKVARTATHLFEYVSYLKAFGGMGRAKTSSLAEWMTSKSPESLAYQAVKYRSRSV